MPSKIGSVAKAGIEAVMGAPLRPAADIAADYGARLGSWWGGLNGTAQGALIGAGAGWLNDDSGSGLDGALTGAAIGAGIGRYGPAGRSGYALGGLRGAATGIGNAMQTDLKMAKGTLGAKAKRAPRGKRTSRAKPQSAAAPRVGSTFSRAISRIKSTVNSSFGAMRRGYDTALVGMKMLVPGAGLSSSTRALTSQFGGLAQAQWKAGMKDVQMSNRINRGLSRSKAAADANRNATLEAARQHSSAVATGAGNRSLAQKQAAIRRGAFI
jgi:hypothetical protein